jgi:glycine cleavage system H lipoate-binding protein
VVNLQDSEFPDHLFYDFDSQIWYEPLGDGTVRTGFTLWAANLMGDVLVFTPKRIGRDFERGRSFAQSSKAENGSARHAPHSTASCWHTMSCWCASRN